MLLLVNNVHEKTSQKVNIDEISKALFVICTRVTTLKSSMWLVSAIFFGQSKARNSFRFIINDKFLCTLLEFTAFFFLQKITLWNCDNNQLWQRKMQQLLQAFKNNF